MVFDRWLSSEKIALTKGLESTHEPQALSLKNYHTGDSWGL